MEDLLEKFNTQINAMLDSCSTEFTPTVCGLISTREGRQTIFELIQRKVIQQKLTIGQAINSIETEFNPNSYAD
jgi:hypothetical protein